MDNKHAIHIGVGCLLGGLLFAGLLVFGAGTGWATAAFVAAMVVCHGVGLFYLKTKGED